MDVPGASVNLKSAKSTNITHFDLNKNLLSDPTRKSNIFNNQFSTIVSKIEKTNPFKPSNFNEFLNKKHHNGTLFINSANSSFYLAPTAPTEVEMLIDAMDMENLPDLIQVILLMIHLLCLIARN